MRISPVTSFGLDLLRVLSIFAVVIGHYVALLGKYDASGFPFPIQSYGVVTMFMLSGFLITASIYSKTAGFTDFRRYRFVDYLIDRGSRIFIVYWPVLIAIVVANNWFAASRGVGLKSSGLSNFIVNFFMLQLHPLWQGPTIGARVDTMSPTWALALEWWIYLLVGWVILVIVAQAKGSAAAGQGFRSGTGVKSWAIAVAAALSIYSIANLIGGSAMPWFLGAALFFVYDKIRATRVTKWVYFGAGLLLIVVCVYAIARGTVGYSTSGIYSTNSYVLSAAWFLCLLVFGQAFTGAGGVFLTVSTRVVRFFSGYMYTLFLTHFTVWVYVGWAKVPFIENMDAMTRLVFMFVLANVVALAIGLLLERHGRAFGNWIKRVTRRGRVTSSVLQTPPA